MYIFLVPPISKNKKYAFITVCCFFQEILRLCHHISIEHNHIYNKVWYYIYIAFHIGTFFWLGYSTCILFSGKDKPIAFPFYIDKQCMCTHIKRKPIHYDFFTHATKIYFVLYCVISLLHSSSSTSTLHATCFNFTFALGDFHFLSWKKW